MSDGVFERLEQVIGERGAEGAFEFLAQKFREEKSYPLLFELRLMQKRRALGLPLLDPRALEDLPEDQQRAYEQGFLEAAREAGGLYLADGDIPRAWPYFRAIGEGAPVAAAIEGVQAQPGGEGLEPVIEIAFFERVHPQKGFELILAHYGACRAITSFQQYPIRKGREESLRLLIRTLYGELRESLRRVIARQEAEPAAESSVAALVRGRDWLFDDNTYYIDTSHVTSVLQFGLELGDRETLALAAELADYGTRLGSMFQFRGEPPFENIFADHLVYLRALLGEDVDAAVAHFRQKIADSDPARAGTAPAQVLVGLLARLERYGEAIEVSIEHLREAPQLACPSVYQLCQAAGDPVRLRQLAREHNDLLSFTAGALTGC